MADNVCVFCGDGLSLLNRKTLYCCTTEQPACRDCHAKLVKLSREELGRRALASGRAQEPETIRAYLKAREEAIQKKQAAEEQAAKDRISDKSCPRCSVPMVKMGQQQFQLGEYDFWLGSMAHAAAGSLTLDLLLCPKCRKVEFFLPESADI